MIATVDGDPTISDPSCVATATIDSVVGDEKCWHQANSGFPVNTQFRLNTLLLSTNRTAPQSMTFKLDVDCWEEDGCGSDCSYDTGILCNDDQDRRQFSSTYSFSKGESKNITLMAPQYYGLTVTATWIVDPIPTTTTTTTSTTIPITTTNVMPTTTIAITTVSSTPTTTSTTNSPSSLSPTTSKLSSSTIITTSNPTSQITSTTQSTSSNSLSSSITAKSPRMITRPKSSPVSSTTPSLSSFVSSSKSSLLSNLLTTITSTLTLTASSHPESSTSTTATTTKSSLTHSNSIILDATNSNSINIQSKTNSINLKSPPFTSTIWFYIIVIAGCCCCCCLLVALIVFVVRKNQNEQKDGDDYELRVQSAITDYNTEISSVASSPTIDSEYGIITVNHPKEDTILRRNVNEPLNEYMIVPCDTASDISMPHSTANDRYSRRSTLMDTPYESLTNTGVIDHPYSSMPTQEQLYPNTSGVLQEVEGGYNSLPIDSGEIESKYIEY